MEKIEETVLSNLDLLEVAKAYCEFNCDKSNAMVVLLSLLDVIITKQRETVTLLIN